MAFDVNAFLGRSEEAAAPEPDSFNVDAFLGRATAPEAAPVPEPAPVVEEPHVDQGPPLPADYIPPEAPKRYKIVKGQLEEVAVTPEQREQERVEAQAQREWQARRHEFLSGELKKQKAQGSLLERYGERAKELRQERRLGEVPKPRVPLIGERKAPGQLQAAGMSVLQGATAGYIDEFGAFVKGVAEAGTRRAEEKINVFDAIGDELQETRRQFGEAQETWPKTYIAGEIAGGIMGLGAGLAARPVGAAAEAAQALTRMQRVGRGAKGGAQLGAIAGAGHADARTVEEAATGAFTGAAGGALGGVVLPVAGRVIAKGAKKLIGDPSARVGRRALDAAVKGASKKVARDLNKFPGGALEALKQSGIDDKMAATAPAEALKKTQQLIEVTGNKIGRAYGALDDSFTGVRTPEILGALRKVQSKLTSVEPAERRAVARLMRDIKKDHGPRGVIPMAEVNDLKSKIAKRAFGGAAMQPSPAKIIEAKLAKALKSAMEKRTKQIVKSIDKAGKQASPQMAEVKGAAEALPEMNKLFGGAKELEKAFERMAGKAPSRTWVQEIVDNPLVGAWRVMLARPARKFIGGLVNSNKAADRALARRAHAKMAKAVQIQREIDQGIIDAPPGFKPRSALAKEFGSEKAGIAAEGIELDVPDIDVDLSGLDVSVP